MRRYALIATLVSLLLMTVPYLIYRPQAGYSFDLVFTSGQHLLFMAVFSVISILAVFAVTEKGEMGRVPLPQGPRGLYLYSSAKILLCIFFASQLFLYPALLAYMHGGFTAARNSKLFAGVGVLYRLYIPALPIIFFYNKSSKAKAIILFITSILVFGRALLLSERSTSLELVAVLVTLDLSHTFRMRKILLPLGLTAIFGLYVAGLQARMYTQAQYGAHDAVHTQALHSSAAGSAAASSIVYYTDTQNKAYGMLSGVLPPYGEKRCLQFILPLISPNVEGKAYMAENEASGYTLASLTNPGGLAEDISDFGLFGVVVAIFQFALAALILRLSRHNVLAYVLMPIILVWYVEFARFNYYYLPFIVTLTFIIIAWTLSSAFVQSGNRLRFPNRRPALGERSMQDVSATGNVRDRHTYRPVSTRHRTPRY